MSKSILLITVMILSVLLGACEGAPNPSSPESPVTEPYPALAIPHDMPCGFSADRGVPEESPGTRIELHQAVVVGCRPDRFPGAR